VDRLLNNVGRLTHLAGAQIDDDSVSFPVGSVPCAWMASSMWLKPRTSSFELIVRGIRAWSSRLIALQLMA